uniref:uncharacterized protein LOC120951953 isoform X1 n=2 Tax=Anopheles coluzzii TaxID=1518534 RepID=UPI0020FF9A55|nr:uncharacterized protein LOC120951953 isoform X1 [Anopheles coluzzii]
MSSHGRQRTISMTNDISIIFIRAVKKKPVIWCKNSPDHKNKQAQINAWMELEVEFEMPWEQLHKKWISLNSSFRHYKKIESKQVGKKQTTPKWYAYNELQFLNTATDTSSSSDMPGESPPPSGPSFSPTDETLNRDEEEFLKWFVEEFKKFPPNCRQHIMEKTLKCAANPYKIEKYYDE